MTNDVKHIGAVMRLYSGIVDDTNKIKETNANSIMLFLGSNFDKHIFVIDREVTTETNTPENIQNKIDIISKFINDRVKDIIEGKFSFTGTTYKEINEGTKTNKTLNITILVNSEHYNGTGSFNVSFNYIRKPENNFNDYLWFFSDDDDMINADKCNKLIHDVINNEIELFDKDNIEPHNNIRRTQRETDIINGKRFIISDIIYHMSADKTHMIEYSDKTQCNFWSILFSPIVYKDLTCRLLPFGREDMDMMNYLMVNDLNNIIVVNNNENFTNNDESFIDYMISNNVIRINTLCLEKSVYNFYIHNKSKGKNNYGNFENISSYDASVIDYMNNHKNLLTKRNILNTPYYVNCKNTYKKESEEINDRIKNTIPEIKDDFNRKANKEAKSFSMHPHGPNQMFFYGVGDNYTQYSNEYGIPTIKEFTNEVYKSTRHCDNIILKLKNIVKNNIGYNKNIIHDITNMFTIQERENINESIDNKLNIPQNIVKHINKRLHKILISNNIDTKTTNNIISNIEFNKLHLNVIPPTENALGELYIATYKDITNGVIYRMFMNGKDENVLSNETIKCIISGFENLCKFISSFDNDDNIMKNIFENESNTKKWNELYNKDLLISTSLYKEPFDPKYNVPTKVFGGCNTLIIILKCILLLIIIIIIIMIIVYLNSNHSHKCFNTLENTLF